MTPQTASLEHLAKAQAYGLGFDLCGIAALGPAVTAGAFDDWLRSGYDGDMTYLGRLADVRRDTRRPHPGVTHALVVGMNYGGTQPGGPVARYARGDDYHDVMRAKLRELHAWLESRVGRDIDARAYVDTGPILERDLARRAGLGWIGKNTLLISPALGSCFFIGALFVALELEPDEPFDADRCGRCTRCLDACPTHAFVSPRVLDARRCISYLTIESREAMPEPLRPLVGEALYGCDICQDVCPWNVKFARDAREPAFAPRVMLAGTDAPTLARAILPMSPQQYAAAFARSPMKRAKLAGLKRNAAIVLGNAGDAGDVDLLGRAADDGESLVREHAAWALRQVQERASAP